MKVAVTGASGHIGNCIVRELVNYGLKVKVLIHNFENDLAQPQVEFVKGNILNQDSLNRLCDGVDVVFHLAAQIDINNRNSKEVYSVNVNGTQNIIDAAVRKNIKKFIHFSSIHAFQTKPVNEVLDENRSLIESDEAIYEFTKAESEKLVLKAAREGLNAIILCPTAVIGPYDYRGSYMGKALLQIYNNKLPALVPGGYNWIDVRDVASVALNAIKMGGQGEKYILSGNFCTLKNLSLMIGSIFQRKTPRILVPFILAKLACPLIQFYSSIANKHPLYTNQSLDILKHSPRNISFKKAQTELAFYPRKLEETLQDTIEWYKQNNYLKE